MVLLTAGYFLKYSGHAMFDVFLTLLFVLSMLVYRGAWESSHLRDWALLGLLAGLGVLTKSVLGVFPLVVVCAHLLWCGRARTALAGVLWLSVLVMLLTNGPGTAHSWRCNRSCSSASTSRGCCGSAGSSSGARPRRSRRA